MATNKSRARKLKWGIGALVIIAALTYLSLVMLPEFAVYFYTPSEALAKAESLSAREIKVGGMVKGGSMQWTPETINLRFVLTDLNSAEIPVVHQGTPPDMFKENSGVVVEGKISPDGKQFLAKKLMVKHSEEYKAPDGKHSMDRELLEKSLAR